MLTEQKLLASAKHWDPYRASLCEIIVIRRVPRLANHKKFYVPFLDKVGILKAFFVKIN